MVPGAGWEAHYAVYEDGAWDFTTTKNLPVLMWHGDESGNLVGWVVSPSDIGEPAGTLKAAPSVSFAAPDGRALTFVKYVP